MDRLTLKNLLDKHALGTLSEQESQQLRLFLDTQEGQQLLSEVWDADFQATPLEEEPQTQEDVYRRVESDDRFIAASPRPVTTHSAKGWGFQLAAALALLLGVAALYVYNHTSFSDTQIVASTEDIMPGSDRARIVFDDGTYVELEAIEQDTVLADKGIIVFKDENGAVGYRFDDSAESETNLYTSVITPKGGEHKLVLPDGSQVWLNAASTLRYPLTFAADSREISLEGEAYFQVKPQTKGGKSIPFIVRTGEQRLEVLGTSFNINSYGPQVTTTLVEGAVALHFPHTDQARRLQPNQQSAYDPQKGSCVVKTVDPYFATAWRQGSFAFENASIYTVMDDIARWYDIEVEYTADLSDIRYSGTISRFENFKQLLQIIEWTDLVTFSVEGRRVRVMR